MTGYVTLSAASEERGEHLAAKGKRAALNYCRTKPASRGKSNSQLNAKEQLVNGPNETSE